MPDLADATKRLLLGRPVRTERMAHTLLPKRLALPVFASDALSSVAYAPDEILLTLSIAGMSAYALGPWVGLAVSVVLVTVVASYKQTVHAYPSGGGDYEVATVNLGARAGLTVASALLVDYVLTVAVSISSASHYLATMLPDLRGHEGQVAMGLVTFLAVLNLRGVRESGKALAIPTYVFMAAMGLLLVFGFLQSALGMLPPAPSAQYRLAAEPGFDEGLTGLAGALLVLRAFSSGCVALTGLETVSNGVPAFQKPKSRNAAATLLLLGSIAVVMMMSILVLAQRAGVRFVEDPRTQLVQANGQPVPEGYEQDPVIGQLAQTVFHQMPVLFFLVTSATGLILLLAANTAFNGFPVLGSILAKDGFLPRQLHTRGDRLAFSNGIVILAVGAGALILVFDAQVTRLIQVYIVAVFLSFTLSQLGMTRHWTRLLQTTADPAERTRMTRSRAVNSFGFVMTAVVLAVVLVTRAVQGAWTAILLMAMLYVVMRGIRAHYDRVARDLAASGTPGERALPARVHAIVLVSKLHKPTLRALSYARATRPSVLEAVTVAVDEDAQRLREEWENAGLPVPLTVLDSPYREVTRPVLEYVRSIRRESPRDLVVVYIPEYVLGHWWEQLLHNQSALRLKSRLRFTPGVVVASVPWQLMSTAELDKWAMGQHETTELGWSRRGE